MDEADLTVLVHNLVSNDQLCVAALGPMRIHDILALMSLNPHWKTWPWAFGCPVESTADGRRHFRSDQPDGGILAYWNGKVLADIVEALIGVFYLHGDVKKAGAFLDRHAILDGVHNTEAEPETAKAATAAGHMVACASFDDARLYSAKVKRVQRILNYNFKRPALLVTALTHPSYAHAGAETTYERLEFLGDAALGLPITRSFFDRYPAASPGELTTLKGEGLSNIFFARVLVGAGLHRYVFHNSVSLDVDTAAFITALNDEASGAAPDAVDAATPPKALGDFLESLAGAVLVDAGGNVDAMWAVMGPLLDEPLRRHAALHVLEERPEAKLKRETRVSDGKEPQFVFTELAPAATAAANGATVLCKVRLGRKTLAVCPGRNRRHARRCACEMALGVVREGVQRIPPTLPAAGAGGGAATPAATTAVSAAAAAAAATATAAAAAANHCQW